MGADDQVAGHGVDQCGGADRVGDGAGGGFLRFHLHVLRGVAEGALGMVRGAHGVGALGGEGVGLLGGGGGGGVDFFGAAYAEGCCGVLGAEAVAEGGDLACLLRREAEDAGGVADGAAAAPGDVFADHRGVFAAVAGVDVLQDALAFAVGEVDVDVRRLGALFAEEAFEEQLEFDGVHGGDAEAVADSAVGG